MISLGCAKNLVDAEVMLGDIVAQGMEVTADLEEADVLIVNTCAFIDSAKEESIEAIISRFDTAGIYRLWAQFRLPDGSVITAPFTVRAA